MPTVMSFTVLLVRKICSPEGVKELIQRRRAVLPNAITIEDQVAEAANS